MTNNTGLQLTGMLLLIDHDAQGTEMKHANLCEQ